MVILNGNALHLPLADESVQCCVTSPPYWGLRDYGTDGQLGLEPAPEEYVANLVAVFREVRRVLRRDGVVFLNLGDSYAGSTTGADRPPEPGHDRADNGRVKTGNEGKVARPAAIGLKPKDLCGIPWRVAFALQQPYYTGVIRDEKDRIWLAAMVDTEGCMFIHKRKAGQSNGQGYQRLNASYSPGLEIANTSLALIERIAALVGKGSICSQGPEQNGRRKQTIYRWNLRTLECRDLIRELYPHLVAKQHQARILCGCPSSGEKAGAAHMALMGLHNGEPTDVDYPAPASMYEPGWYLRSDIIWKKPNPMPESVKDRPTRSHEYLFLLTKSARYWYDAEAVKEPSVMKAQNRNTNGRGDKDDGYAAHRKAPGMTAPSTRNKRDVWTISTKPFSGARLLADYVGLDGKPYTASPDCPIHGHLARTQKTYTAGCDARPVDPESRNPDNGDSHEPSRLGALASTTCHTIPDADDASSLRQTPESNRDHRSADDHRESTLPAQTAGRTNRTSEVRAVQDHMWDSPDPSRVPIASARNTQTRKTGLAPATILPYTPCAQIDDRTPRTSESRESVEPSRSNGESSSASDGSACSASPQTPGRTVHNELESASFVAFPTSNPNHTCTCSIVQVDHFATMPPDLVEPCILAGSKAGDVVLDPFAGAGTVPMVAERHGRCGIGVELSMDYCKMAAERIYQDAPLWNGAR